MKAKSKIYLIQYYHKKDNGKIVPYYLQKAVGAKVTLTLFHGTDIKGRPFAYDKNGFIIHGKKSKMKNILKKLRSSANRYVKQNRSAEEGYSIDYFKVIPADGVINKFNMDEALK